MPMIAYSVWVYIAWFLAGLTNTLIMPFSDPANLHMNLYIRDTNTDTSAICLSNVYVFIQRIYNYALVFLSKHRLTNTYVIHVWYMYNPTPVFTCVIL